MDSTISKRSSKDAALRSIKVSCESPGANRDFRVMDDSGNELKFTDPVPDD